MGKFNYLWFRNILLLSAGMWGLAVPYAVADDKMKESPITEQVRTKIQVSGVVVDSNGEPLIGATIREKESGNGTITDVDGKFTLSIPVDAVIVVSYVGYRDKLIAVNGKTSFKINTWREDKFERSVANGTETVFVTLRFCVVRKQLKATLKPNAAGVQLPPHYYRNG